MRAGIRASGNGLIVRDNTIRDDAKKRWWTDNIGTGVAGENTSFNSRAIEWAGWNVLIRDNDFEVYRHRLVDSELLSNVIKNNKSLNMGLIKSSCDVRVGENMGFVRSPC